MKVFLIGLVIAMLIFGALLIKNKGHLTSPDKQSTNSPTGATQAEKTPTDNSGNAVPGTTTTNQPNSPQTQEVTPNATEGLQKQDAIPTH